MAKNSTKKQTTLLDRLAQLESKVEQLTECQAGVNELQYELGILSYNYGNIMKAEYYLKSAADKYFAPAQFKLGLLYNAAGKKEEAERVFKLIKPKGNNNILFQIGNLYKEWGDEKQAEHYFKTASEGSSEFQFKLGLSYKKQGNIVQAEHYLKSAADQSHSYAQAKLGQLYLSSDQLKNSEKALHYLELSSKRGNAAGQFTLAEYHLRKGDKEKAEQYYKMAAEQELNQQVFKSIEEYIMDPVEFSRTTLCVEYDYNNYC